MIIRTALILASVASVSFAAVRSGKIEADLIGQTKSYEAGKPVQTAVRLVVDKGWHTYWLNPGEGGMKISVEWELPAGWTAGELEHPVPKRFVTSDLPGFGYEGTVVLPVKFTPPAGFTGPAKLKGKISWLTCDDQTCLPGEAEIELSLEAGAPVASAEAAVVAEALQKIPAPSAGGVTLTVVEQPKTLQLIIQGLADKPDGAGVFPATPEVVDAAAKFDFTAQGDKWTAEVPKNEYAATPIQELTLVLAGKAKQAPLALKWTAAPAKSH